MATLQEVFRTHFPAFAQGRSLHSRELDAARAIMTCFTAEAGSHIDRCPSGHFARETFHACRHRCCPKCADQPRQRWLSSQFERLLPVPHMHVVFTLPHELLPLWECNRKALAQLLFDASRQTLLRLLADPRHLGATPGLLLSLHTWGRTLSHHPHIHALVTCGGLDSSGLWRSTRPGWLLPLAVLRKLFCGTFLALLAELLPTLKLPARLPLAHWHALRHRLYRAHWNIQINPPYQHGRGVALYLARYAKGGPLPSSRTLHCTPAHVLFDYTDHRDGLHKTLRLLPPEFIARVLWHAPPKGSHCVRHAGLYATARRRQHGLARICLAAACPPELPPAAPSASPLTISTPRPAVPCPTCNRPMSRQHLRPLHHRPHQISSFSYRPYPADLNTPSPTAGAARPNEPFKRKFDGMPLAGEAKASPPSTTPSNSA